MDPGDDTWSLPYVPKDKNEIELHKYLRKERDKRTEDWRNRSKRSFTSYNHYEES